MIWPRSRTRPATRGVGPPTSVQDDEPTNAELMRKLLDIQRTVSKIQKGLSNGG